MARKGTDLTGRRFGSLTALAPTGERKNGYTVWRCLCDCGQETMAPSRHLKNGWALDCGCGRGRADAPRRYPDLTGRRYGRLVVLGEAEERDVRGQVLWRCRCDCGKETVAATGQLNAGYKKSCGCLGRPPLKDLIGQQFGTLTVTAYAGKRGGFHYWHCRCDCGCGQELDVCQSSLLSGKTKGCGSLKRNRPPQWEGKRFGSLTVTAYAGKRDGKYYWECRCDCGNTLTVTQGNLSSGHTKSCGCRAGLAGSRHFVDGTCIESIRSRKPFANNTSGVRGVYRNRASGKWRAQITFQGHTKHLGCFESLEDAAAARAQAEEIFDDVLERYDSGVAAAP